MSKSLDIAINALEEIIAMCDAGKVAWALDPESIEWTAIKALRDIRREQLLFPEGAE